MFDVQLYFSGDVSEEVERHLIDRQVYRLHSFAYPKYGPQYLAIASSMDKRATLLVDSGAFTSWSIGKPVQLADLLAYNDKLIKQYGHLHDLLFIALDVIPGERGRGATSGEIHKAVEQSYDNFLTMQQHYKHHRVLPVFHSGEDFSLRDAYLRLTDYICLSMNQDMSERNRVEWALRAAAPGYRYHGLAATGNRMVTEIPWYSVDSSSWLTVSNMGNILWPSNGRFRTLAVSKESPDRHVAGAHYLTLTPMERASVDKLLGQYGYTFETLSEHYEPRRKFNADMWCNTPWRRRIQAPMDLFGNA